MSVQWNKVSRFSPVLLRSAIAIVFLWFGFSQLKNPDQWTRMVPEYVQSFSPLSIQNLILVHGIFEITCAVFLLLGLYTRTASLLLALNLLHITFIVGYGPTGARDFVIGLAALAITLRGSDEFCLDQLLWKKKAVTPQQS